MKTITTTSHAPAWILGAAAAVLATTIGVRASAPGGQATKPAPASAANAEQDEEAFAALGEKTTEQICIICHPWENITQKRRTVREWNEVIVNMAQRGAPGTKQQFGVVAKFLARYYGALHVNSATAEEFSTVLGLSAKDARAIVEHRKANGKFADAAALAKVEGIDVKKIEEQADALIFD
jgi:competence ComEA-like helix-hairpin-helix protein